VEKSMAGRKEGMHNNEKNVGRAVAISLDKLYTQNLKIRNNVNLQVGGVLKSCKFIT
jgi:hypothetical protein